MPPRNTSIGMTTSLRLFLDIFVVDPLLSIVRLNEECRNFSIFLEVISPLA